MHLTVERLRLGLLVGAVLLVGVIASFLGYARLRGHRFLKDLPGRMGAELRQETNGYTYSQTVGGRTVFTIHAAKAIQRKDGKVTLHDVGIVLYGRTQAGVTKTSATKGGGRTDGGGPELADRIYGKEFEYDQGAGVVRATGEVHIDLEAPIPADSKAKMDFAAGVEAQHDPNLAPVDDRVVHVKTSGLVFLQKLGVASTEQEIEFAYRGMKGQAIGADYNTDTGVLVLQSEVVVTGVRGDRPAVLRAGHAEMNRTTDQVRLTRARYSSPGTTRGSGEVRGEETASADDVIFHGGDGAAGAVAERLEARGSVMLTEGEATVTGGEGQMLLNAANHPQSVMLSGGVGFRSEDGTRALHGTADEGRGRFDGAGGLEQMVMTGRVAVHETERGAGAQESERNLSSGRLELALGKAPGGRQWLKEAVADGDARLQVVTSETATEAAMKSGKIPVAGAKAGVPETSELRGDHLRARLRLVNGMGELNRVEGTGHTWVRRVGARGEDTSQGNSLVADFRVAGAGTGAGPGAGTGARAGAGTRQEIASAVQVGDVAMTHVDAAAGAVPEHGTAERAVYEGDAQRLTLTGGVRLTDAGSVLLADRVSMLQATGDATATGSVRASYLQAGADGGDHATGEPVHVLAERAELEHAAGRATFYGGSGAARPDARLWQGGSQVEAPVIELGQTERTLRAHGLGSEAKGAVRTVLTSGGSGPGSARGADASPARAASPDGAAKGDVLRVASRELVYSDAARRADFTGGVVLEDAQGTMRSARAEVFLEPAKTAGEGSRKIAVVGTGDGRPGVKGAGGKTATASAGTSGLMGGSVERIVASGGVEIQQPTRLGRGEQLVYTAADGYCVMTGTPGAPPRIVDEARGTVVGQTLRFSSGDNSVVASGDAGRSAGLRSGNGNRVRTETRVRQAR